MTDYSIIGGSSPMVAHGFSPSTNQGTNVTASGTTDTKGAWSELVTAANNVTPSNNIVVFFTVNTGTQADFLVDIGIGGAGSEVVILPNIWVNTNNVSAGEGVFSVPLSIPAGQRVAARCQSNSSSAVMPVHIGLTAKSLRQSAALPRATVYGANTSTTDGVVVATTTAGTFGSWVEIVASTTNRIKGFVVAAHRSGVSWTPGYCTYEVAVGSAGNEEIIFPGMQVATTTSEGLSDYFSPFIGVGVAQGERLAIRASSDVTNTDFDMSYIITGYD